MDCYDKTKHQHELRKRIDALYQNQQGTKPELFYADRSDRLTDDQIDTLFECGVDYAIESLSEVEGDWFYQNLSYGHYEDDLEAMFPGRRQLIVDLEEAGEFYEANELSEETVMALWENDCSDWMRDIARNTSVLLQIGRAGGIEPTAESIRAGLDNLGVTADSTTVDAVIQELIDHRVYGHNDHYITVLAYLDLGPFWTWGDKTITLTGFHVAMIDSYNGTCAIAEVESGEYVATNPLINRDGAMGYGSADEICGLVTSAFRPDHYEFTTTED